MLKKTIKSRFTCTSNPILVVWGSDDFTDISGCYAGELDERLYRNTKMVSEKGKYSMWCVICGYGSVSSFSKHETIQWWNEQYEFRKKAYEEWE